MFDDHFLSNELIGPVFFLMFKLILFLNAGIIIDMYSFQITADSHSDDKISKICLLECFKHRTTPSWFAYYSTYYLEEEILSLYFIVLL